MQDYGRSRRDVDRNENLTRCKTSLMIQFPLLIFINPFWCRWNCRQISDNFNVSLASVSFSAQCFPHSNLFISFRSLPSELQISLISIIIWLWTVDDWISEINLSCKVVISSADDGVFLFRRYDSRFVLLVLLQSILLDSSPLNLQPRQSL